MITYYLQKRHIFGDMKLEVHDSTGKLLATLPTSKRRGLSRATWSMRMPPARIPPAASVAFGVGPRYLPGTYTVKLVEGDSTYTTPLRITRDARMKHALADRQAQFDLSVRLYGILNEMTGVVEKMNGVRGALENRAVTLTASDSLAFKLRGASGTVDDMRKKIVATKEGGMITGEERLRENLASLYGSVVGYDRARAGRTVQAIRPLGRARAWAAQHHARRQASPTDRARRALTFDTGRRLNRIAERRMASQRGMATDEFLFAVPVTVSVFGQLNTMLGARYG